MKESIFVILLVIGIILVAYIGEMHAPVPEYSTRNKGDSGALALYMLLEKYTQVNRVYNPLTDIPDGTLVVIEPAYAMNHKEIEYIHQWVKKGNTLVVFSDNPHIMRTFDVTLSSTERTHAVLSPVKSHPSTEHAKKIKVTYTYYFNYHNGKELFTHGKKPICICISHGTGDIVLISAPSMVQNHSISEYDNEIFLVYLMLSDTVSFDEYHLVKPKNGFNIKNITGIFSSRYSSFFIQFITAILLFLVISAKRLGSPRPVPPQEVQSSELVVQAADLYYKAGKKILGDNNEHI